MLRDKSSSAIVAVRDLDRAKTFYGDVLSLELTSAPDEDVAVYRTGATYLCVYVSEFAGTNQANAVAWGVGEDIEAIAAELAGRGVTFERYDMPDTTFENGVHRSGDFRTVWFKDPDGNILHLNSGD